MQILRLGDVCTKIGSGATPRGGSEVYLPDGVALIRSQNVYNDGFHSEGLAFIGEMHARELQSVEVQAGDVLLNITGDSVARACLAPIDVLPARVNQHVAIIRPRSHTLDARYLRYYLVSPTKQASMLSIAGGGATRNALTKGMIENFEIPAPPIEEQRAIANVLGSLDEKIEHNRKTSHALEALARATFKAWFVDFEPVKAKAAGQTSFPGMPADVFTAIPDRLVDSPLGLIPVGWKVNSLNHVFEINPTRKLPKGAVAPYLDMKNMPTRGHAAELWDSRAFGSGMKFINGDTLVARITPCLENGKTAFVDFLTNDEVGWGSTEYIVLRPKHPLPLTFAYFLARSDRFRDFAIQNMSGTSGRQRVAASVLEHFHIAVPDSAASSSFRDIVDPIFQLIRAGKNESMKLSAVRDYLLPRLLSGQVRVRSAEAAVEDVA